jgi:hypothetical protein
MQGREIILSLHSITTLNVSEVCWPTWLIALVFSAMMLFVFSRMPSSLLISQMIIIIKITLIPANPYCNSGAIIVSDD